MAKRFIDTNFYKSPFVRGLKGSLKGLYTFIICDCDGAGIWVKDLQIASAYIGFEITEKDFLVFLEKGKAIDLENGKYFFPDFIEHQYSQGLSDKNPAQKNFISSLKKYNLIDENLQIIKTLKRPSKGSKVMVMVKEDEIVKEEVMVIGDENLSSLDKKLIEFLKFRKEMKKPILEASKQSFLNKLNKLANGNENVAVEILEQSMANGWQGIFELKTDLSLKTEKQPVDPFAHLR